MKTKLFGVILILTLTAATQTRTQTRKIAPASKPAPVKGADQNAINQTEAALKEDIDQIGVVSARMTELDQSDAEIKKSDEAQSYTSQTVNKQLAKLKNEDAHAIQGRAEQWDIKRQRHIDGGCPAEGGRMPVDQANRCNAETDRLMAEHDQIFRDAEYTRKQIEEYEKLRDAVSKTTLENFTKRKANNAEREALNAQLAQLNATKAKLTAQLKDLRDGVDSCAKVLSARRGETCETIKAKCGNVQFDGQSVGLPPSVYDTRCGTDPSGKPKTGGASANN